MKSKYEEALEQLGDIDLISPYGYNYGKVWQRKSSFVHLKELVDRATATKVVGEFENNDKTIWGYCPHCNEMVLRGYSKWNYVKPLVKGKYCYKCSQKLLWEGYENEEQDT